MKNLFNNKNKVNVKTESRKTSIIEQILIISVITLISMFIEKALPIPMPASVIGLLLMFIALCTKIIKLEQVEKVGTALTDNIGLLFVPSGISVINSLDILAQNPILILSLIIISTILLLVVTGKLTDLILSFNPKTIINKTKGILSELDTNENANAEGRI